MAVPVPTDAIWVEHLAKSYGRQRVIDDLSFRVRRGDVFALLGPNGAGKTTTVEILEGYRIADTGHVHVLGLDPRKDAGRLKELVGIMLQQGGIYPGITAGEVLTLFARFHAQPADPGALLEQVGLTAARNTRFRRLSGGQQRRLALAVALVGQPELIFLDEPTSGMDPQARLLTWSLIRDLKNRGATVVLTTHLMEEAERLADRIAIIDHGRLLAEGTAQQLRQRQHGDHSSIRFTVAEALDVAVLAALPGVAGVREEGKGVYRLDAADPGAVAATLTAWLRDRHLLLEELRIGGATLEEVFLQLTGTAPRQ